MLKAAHPKSAINHEESNAYQPNCCNESDAVHQHSHSTESGVGDAPRVPHFFPVTKEETQAVTEWHESLRAMTNGLRGTTAAHLDRLLNSDQASEAACLSESTVCAYFVLLQRGMMLYACPSRVVNPLCSLERTA